MRQKYLFILFFIPIFYSCQKTPATFQEELAGMLAPSSKYYREIRKNGYLIQVVYLPVRYFELRQLTALGDSSIAEAQQNAIEQARKSYSNGLYFMVTFGYEDASKDIMHDRVQQFDQWSQDLQKFLFRMGDYIYLQTAQHHEIPLGIYNFERSFGLTKTRKMIMSFPLKFNEQPILSQESKFLKLVFKEFGFGIGKQKVEWYVDQITNNKKQMINKLQKAKNEIK